MAHTPDWGSYFCKINGSISSVAVDLALLDSPVLTARPTLIYVHVDLLEPTQDGLSTPEEAPRLYELEDGLVGSLASALDAVQTGRVTGAGRRELYFHARSAEGLDAAVGEIHLTFGEYTVEAGSHEDAAGEHYRAVLYPTPVERHLMQNRKVLHQLLEHGDDLRAERPVDHLLVFSAAEGRDALAEIAEQSGFVVTGRPATGDHFGLQLQMVQPVLPAAIDETTAWLVGQAAPLGGDYDGWGCPIVQGDGETGDDA